MMMIVALGLIPGLLLGWIVLTVTELTAEHPELAKGRGCHGGACRRS